MYKAFRMMGFTNKHFKPIKSAGSPPGICFSFESFFKIDDFITASVYFSDYNPLKNTGDGNLNYDEEEYFLPENFTSDQGGSAKCGDLKCENDDDGN